MSSAFNPRLLALKRQPPPPQRAVAVPRHPRGGLFLKGPIPWNWLGAAAQLPGRALHVATAVWFLAGVKKTAQVELSGKVLRELGVGRHSAYRGLRALKRAHLVQVKQHPGRNPVVTILGLDNANEYPQ